MSRKSSSRSQVSAARRSAQDCWQHGRMLSKAGKWDEALRFFEQALAQDPGDDVYLINAAHACLHLRRMEDVVRYASSAISGNPKAALAYVLKAKALNALQRHAENLTFLHTWSDELQSTHDYWFHLGLAHHGMQQHREAINAFLQAMQLKLDDELTHYYLGSAFYEAGLKEEAAECFRTSLTLGLGRHALHVHGLLAFAERENCRWELVREELRSIQALLEGFTLADAVMTSPFAHLSLTDDPFHHLKISTLMANTWANLSRVVPRPSCSSKGSRIRLGYLSGDFHQHATCVLMAEVFEHHDRERFEVFAYSHGIDDGSPMRQRVMAALEHFVDLRGLSDEQAAQRIADDEIDVLIDLKGYTAHHRLGIMARRPAPVQATFLGFPGTTGGKFMDYIIGDPVVTPLAHADHFAEKIAQMPVCYQPNDRQRPRPTHMARAEVGLPDDAVVLCGFNQAYKISPDVLDVWCEVLRELPEAVLWLLDWHGQARPNLEREIEARGVGLERVYWAPKASLSVHISRMRLADVFLDTWPYNAHTTCSDALWAGLPVVTYEGQTFACRVAASLLMACELGDWVAKTLDDYRQKVITLARDPALRQQLRTHLDAARERSPLFDSARFTLDLEALIQRMQARHRASLSPEALPGQPVSVVEDGASPRPVLTGVAKAKLIAFAVFGEDPKYRAGMLANVRAAQAHYPGWKLIVYCDRVNYEALMRVNLGDHTACVLQQEFSQGVEGMSWRLLAVLRPEAEVVLFRDADSVFSQREVAAVKEWLSTDLDAHIIRDHPYHYSPIMGGLLGVRGRALEILAGLTRERMSAHRLTEYGDDQVFLSQDLYPRVLDMALVHTNSVRIFPEYVLPLPPDTPGERFIGAYAFLSEAEHEQYEAVRRQAGAVTLLPKWCETHPQLHELYKRTQRVARIAYESRTAL